MSAQETHAIEHNPSSNPVDRLFQSALSWLRNNYARYTFYLERDIVWTVQTHLSQVIEAQRLSYRVYNDFPMLRGRRRSLSTDLALLDERDTVQVAVEFKYEPSHTRGGVDIWPTKLNPSVVSWGKEGVLKDIERIQTYIAEGKAKVGYAILIDEGGHFCRRQPPPGSRWVVWDQGVWALVARVSASQGQVSLCGKP